MAHVVRFHQVGGPEVLRDRRSRRPAARQGRGPDQHQGAGAEPRRVDVPQRPVPGRPQAARSPGLRGGGYRRRVGPGVQGFKVGDAVSTIPSFSLNDYGLYGDLANAPAHAVTHHPASLSWAEAAAVWMQYLTAYGALIDIGKLTKGDTILIPAASSSVGLAAIQIANKVGAIPIALTRGNSKRQALLDAGAAHVIATDEQDLVKEVLGHHGRQGCPHRVRPGRRPDRREARAGDGPAGHPVPLRCAQPGADAAAAVRRPGQVGHDSRLRDDGDHERSRSAWNGRRQFVNDGLADGSLKPLIAKTFPLDEIVEAHRYLESNQQIGKVVVTV